MKITKEFNWHMAHRLNDHKGLCNNIHGHTYKLIVEVERTTEEKVIKDDKSSKDMVIDFTDLKNAVNEVIVDKFDHSLVIYEKDEDGKSIAEFAKEKIKQKVLYLPCRTTAERMAQWMYDELNEYLLSLGYGIKCTKIELYETPTSKAIYLG